MTDPELETIKHLLRDADGSGEALTMMGDRPPEFYVRTCKDAIWNWGIRHMHGIAFTSMVSVAGETWRSNEDALQAWNKALKYWESKCKSE
jgi:hypothetical protein